LRLKGRFTASWTNYSVEIIRGGGASRAHHAVLHKRRFPSSMRIAPNWRRFVHTFLSLQSADWIAGTVLRSLSLPWKIAFPDGGAGLGRDSVRMLGQCDGKLVLSGR